MLVTRLLVAAGGLFTLSSAAPVLSAAPKEGRLAKRGDSYRVYGGDGSMAHGWPDVGAWVGSFDTM